MGGAVWGVGGEVWGGGGGGLGGGVGWGGERGGGVVYPYECVFECVCMRVVVDALCTWVIVYVRSLIHI